jgi:hypothetical protein
VLTTNEGNGKWDFIFACDFSVFLWVFVCSRIKVRMKKI